MRNRLMAASAAVLLLPWAADAAVPVEQIEAYEDASAPYTHYAPVEFGGAATVTNQTGFPASTVFHAVSSSYQSNTYSSHANLVGTLMYGTGTVAAPYVTDVYALPYDVFLNDQVMTQDNPANSTAVPGHFVSGVKVVNNSYVTDYSTTPPDPADTDALRRMDFMINRDDVVFVAGAVSSQTVGSTTYYFDLDWSSFNTLDVAGDQETFSPTASPGKQHADLFRNGATSFSCGVVSGYAAALIGNAGAASQTDGEHAATVRSILMAGASKAAYIRQTANNLDIMRGAGIPDYDSSLSILQAGEKPILSVTSNAVTGTPITTQKGWSYGTITAGGQQAVLFQAANTITGITASLNWNVTVASTATSIDTSSVIFPNLALNVYPVTFSAGKYTLGTAYTTVGLSSALAEDNVQYLYSTSTLPAGTYAFVITGDTTGLSTAAAFSYALAGSFASQWSAGSGASWGTVTDWTNGIPNGQAAQANLLSGSGTITLDGDRTIGQLTFGSSSGYTLAQGTVPSGTPNGGVLTIDDTGDSSATVNPLITVSAGSHTISAPVVLANGVTVNSATSSGLTISGAVTGSGGLTKTGGGWLTLSGADTFGNTTINGGLLTLAPTGSIASGTININSTGTLKFAASTASGILVRTVVPAININSGGTVAVAAPVTQSSRQLLIPTGGLTIAGSTNAWTAKLDLGSNDLDIPAGNLATLTNQIKQGSANGAWTGNGITSSAAAASTTHLTALGVILNNDGSGHTIYGSSGSLGLFDGQNPALNDVLVKYTYYGDANLDGIVDGSDYTKIDNGFNSHLTGWANGDFNYDGVIDGSDYTLIDNAFNTQGGSLSPSIADLILSPTAQIQSTSVVPEPAMISLLSLTVALLTRRRQRTLATANSLAKKPN